MKKVTFLLLIMVGFSPLFAQTVLMPAVVFKEHPQTHNMHIASDGKFLYTCNGGKADYGQISKLDLDGNKIGSYKFDLDMRSIMYNSADKKLYINTYGQELYKVDDIMMGTYSKIFDFKELSEQAAPAMSPNGKLIYFNEYGNISIYNMKDRSVKNKLYGLKSRDNAITGGTAIAVDKKQIYTWDSDTKTLYVYDLKGNFKKSYILNQGSYGFSLSFVNGMIWVSDDGNYEIGTWYGYKLK